MREGRAYQHNEHLQGGSVNEPKDDVRGLVLAGVALIGRAWVVKILRETDDAKEEREG